MKELSIEEKAKRYNDALKRASNLHKDAVQMDNNMTTKTCEIIFPELAESKDEIIRKEILDYISKATGCKEWIAWLEKQGEQKPADKVEQKGMNIVEEDMTPFQKKVFCIIDTTIEEEHGLKQVCDELLRLAHDEIKQKPAEWSEEDKNVVEDIEEAVINNWFGDTQYIILDWLKSLKERVQPQNTWKPSDVQMKQLSWVAEQNKDNMIGKELISLYKDLKKLKG